MNPGTTNIPSKSNFKFQSEAECNLSRKPPRDAILRIFPSLTKLMKLTSDLFGLHDERKCYCVTNI